MPGKIGFSMFILAVASTVLFSPCPVRAHAASDQEMDRLSERCAKRTADIFRKDYPSRSWKEQDGSSWTVRYEKHYNAKMGRCFMLIRTAWTGPGKESVNNSFLLLNADENRECGEYLDFKEGDITCYIFDKSCRSRNEWDALARPYMSE